MKSLCHQLSPLPLFTGFTDDELEQLQSALSLSIVFLKPEEYLLQADDPAPTLDYLLSGRAQVFLTDYWGRRSIINNIQPGDLLGGAAAFLSAPSLPINAVALTACTVLSIDPQPLRQPESEHAELLNRLQHRIGVIIAQTNLSLCQKLSILSRRSTREKAMAYFSSEALRAGSSTFQIPFSRDELADYLCVNCSALSTELSKLQREGYIQFRRNRFQLLRHDF